MTGPAGKRLVADLRIELPLEKSLLAGRVPIRGFATEEQENTFGRLLGTRRARAALANELVDTVMAITDDFGGALDPVEWRSAFESIEPHDANRTMVVTGDHSAVLNAYVEILRAGAGSRLIGLLPHRRPHAEQVFKAVAADEGLTEAQATLLNELYVLEGRLEHASPDVEADEVREGIERLRQALPALIQSTHTWLRRHGIELE